MAVAVDQNRRRVKESNGHTLHEGRWLREQIAATQKSVTAFSKANDIPFPTIRNWLKQGKMKIRPDYLHRLAAGLGHTKTSLEMALDRARVYAKLEHEETRQRWARDVAAAEATRGKGVAEQLAAGLPAPEFFDQNIEVGSIRRYHDIPLFDMSIACGPWTDVGEAMEVCDPQTIEQGLFRVRLSGDSMKPKWKDGEIVEFKCLRWGEDELELNKDYYVQRDDGLATFKKLVKIEESTLTLQAINKRKYPDLMAVPQVAIVRMAKALAKVMLVE